MLTLTMDTSGEQFGMALARDGEILRQESGTAGRTLDSVLFGTLERLLGGAGVELGAVDCIVVCIGPGSFVGTRIGLAAANTLAVARNIPVLGIDVLQVLASLSDAGEGAPVIGAVNCVRDEIIFRAYTTGAVPLPTGEVALKPAAAFAEGAHGATVMLRPSGLGRASHASAFPGVARVILKDYPELLPAIVRLGAAILAQGGLPSKMPLPAPLYVQMEGAV